MTSTSYKKVSAHPKKKTTKKKQTKKKHTHTTIEEDPSSPALSLSLGGRGSSAVERATPGEEVPGSIPAVAARSLQVGSVSV